MEEVLYPGDFEGVVDALVDSHQCETAAIFLAADVGADEGADPSGVDQGDGAEIKNEGFRLVLADFRLKSEQVRKDEGAGELKNPNAFGGAVRILDLQGLRSHAADVNGESREELLRECENSGQRSDCRGQRQSQD